MVQDVEDDTRICLAVVECKFLLDVFSTSILALTGQFFINKAVTRVDTEDEEHGYHLVDKFVMESNIQRVATLS